MHARLARRRRLVAGPHSATARHRCAVSPMGPVKVELIAGGTTDIGFVASCS